MNIRASGIREQQGLRDRLGEEEEFRSMAVRRMQNAEDQLRHVEGSAKQALPTKKSIEIAGRHACENTK